MLLYNAYAASKDLLRVPMGNYDRANRAMNIVINRQAKKIDTGVFSILTRQPLSSLDLSRQNFTFAMFKPDAEATMQEEILKEAQEKGFEIVYIGDRRRYTDEKARKHYAEHDEQHKNKLFYNPLVKYLMSGEVVPVILQKIDSKNAIEEFKKLAGKSNGTESNTLRYNRTQLISYGPGVNLEYNKIHASGSMSEVLRESSIIFTERELKSIFDDDVYLLIKNGLSAIEEDILKGRVTLSSLLQSIQALKNGTTSSV